MFLLQKQTPCNTGIRTLEPVFCTPLQTNISSFDSYLIKSMHCSCDEVSECLRHLLYTDLKRLPIIYQPVWSLCGLQTTYLYQPVWSLCVLQTTYLCQPVWSLCVPQTTYLCGRVMPPLALPSNSQLV